jgi:N-succinyldiaminopimelate aminotransferase
VYYNSAVRPSRRVAPFGTTVFSEFSALAAKSGAVNLGQGFPDFDGPEEVKEAAVRAIRGGTNQYAVGAGAPALRAAIAEHSARFYGQQVDPGSEITVTSGATEALFDAILGLVDPGDEVVAFEPLYDSYAASVAMAHGALRTVLLRPPDAAHATWWFEPEELRAAFTPKTRLLLLNTPHNPTGKVFTRSELELCAQLCQEHDVPALCDEVYEHLAYAPARHVRLATLPGMASRTLTVSSAGKTFSLTGWKVGWAIGPAALRGAVQAAHQFVTFATAAPLQAAVAEALRLPDAFFSELTTTFSARRDQLTRALTEAGLPPYAAEGSYFVIAPYTHLPGAARFASDFDFCRWLTTEVGVAAIPPSAFYLPEHAAQGQGTARFAFCKKEETLAEAARRLRTIAG